MGDLRLVLGDLVLVESAEVEVAVGAGELVLIVPEAVPGSIEATVGAG